MGKLKDHYFDEINNDDDGYDKYLQDLEIKRMEAEQYIDAYYEAGDVDDELGVPLALFSAIWYASTEILPKLEVQVVIDGKDAIHISTGSAGYVGADWESGFNLPEKVTLPIKCWIHTHPFGRAYFSGTDIRTVTRWETQMKEAYVLGGEGHYGYWSQEESNELQIYTDNKYEETQVWNKDKYILVRSEEE